MEEARGISLLMETWSMNQEQTARVLGKSQSAVANKLRLLRHSDAVVNALRQAGLTERHARALLKLEQEEEKLKAIDYIARMGLSVARTEQYIDDLLKAEEKKPKHINVDQLLNRMSQTLSKIQNCGISAVTERRETENQIVLTITIPK